MNILAVDTSTSSCSVALMRGDELAAEYLLKSDAPLSSRILSSVDTVLRGTGTSLEEIDLLGVALGPGSFTSLRVGIATVKGLALAAGAAVTGFSSLAMLACNIPASPVPVCPLFDARKKEVYAGLYRCDGLPEPLLPDCVAAPAEFLSRLSGPTLFIGEGAVKYRELIEKQLGSDASFAPSFLHAPRAAAGALLSRVAFTDRGTLPLDLLSPAYIRKSEAELAKLQGKI